MINGYNGDKIQDRGSGILWSIIREEMLLSVRRLGGKASALRLIVPTKFLPLTVPDKYLRER